MITKGAENSCWSKISVKQNAVYLQLKRIKLARGVWKILLLGTVLFFILLCSSTVRAFSTVPRILGSKPGRDMRKRFPSIWVLLIKLLQFEWTSISQSELQSLLTKKKYLFKLATGLRPRGCKWRRVCVIIKWHTFNKRYILLVLVTCVTIQVAKTDIEYCQ